MEERGLVARRQVKADARGAVVVLTRPGLKAIAAAAPIHFAGVRRHMIDLLNSSQLETLGDITEIVVGHLTEVEFDRPD